MMTNVINFCEVPVSNMERAMRFYGTVMGWQLEKMDMGGTLMAFFPVDGVGGALVQGEGYSPSTDGAQIYLNGGDDLSDKLQRVGTAGGKVLVPKTQISPEHGYFAMFVDTEGNKMALHSMG